MTIDNIGRVGIGGTPSRSTTEIEEEAEATLRNWDSKDKKPTKAELVKRLTERNIGGGSAKLQVAGDAHFSGNVTARSIYRPESGCGGLLFSGNQNGPYILPLDNTGTTTDGVVDLGQQGSSTYRFKDAHFSGDISSRYVDVTGQVVGSSGRTGIAFSSGLIYPCVWTGSTPAGANSTVDFGSASYKWKDGHFSGTVYANGSPLTRVGDIIETFRTLKNAVSDETTVEGIKEALTNSLGGLIEKFEAMQSAATQEIES